MVGYAPFTLELQFMHLDKIPVIRPGAHPPKTPRFSFFFFNTRELLRENEICFMKKASPASLVPLELFTYLE